MSIAEVAAFPAAMYEAMSRAEKLDMNPEEAIAKLKARLGTPLSPGFNAEEQYVSNQGAHAFVPPNFETGDVRG